MPQGSDDEGETPLSGVVGGPPAQLFDFDEDELLLAASAPFRGMPTSAGRPKGSPNKRTLAMRELYLKMGLPHPILWQGQMLRMKVDELAIALGCKLVEAAELQRKIASDLAPYLESKMPAKVDLGDGELLPVIVIDEGSRELRAERETGAMSIDGDLVDAIAASEQKQQLAPAVGDGSHGGGSHGDGQAADNAQQTSGAATD